MSQLNNQLRFNDDGTPRRRYEIDNSSDGKAALSVTIGLVLASAVALVKNVLYPARAQDLPPMSADASADFRSAPVESGINLFESDSDPLRIDALDDGASTGATPLLRASLAASRSSPAIDTTAFAAVHAAVTSHAAGNDNKALYGAAPGHAVQLGANDTVLLSPVASGSRGFASPGGGRGGGEGSAGHDDGDTLLPGQHVPEREGGNSGTEPGDEPVPTRMLNRAPVVSGAASLNASLGNRFINQVIVIGLADLLVHASDADADTLSVCQITPSSGTLVANREGGWNYMPDPEATGDVTFSYFVSDGHTATSATATLMLAAMPSEPGAAEHGSGDPAVGVRTGSDCHTTELRDDFATPVAQKIMLSAAPIIGTSAADVIHGTVGNDVIWAGAGDDIVDGGDGDDVIHGEGGNDVLTGGKGSDIVSGGDGDDTIVATIDDGDDFYDGGDGEDTLDLTALSDAAPVSPEATPSVATVATEAAGAVVSGPGEVADVGPTAAAAVEPAAPGEAAPPAAVAAIAEAAVAVDQPCAAIEACFADPVVLHPEAALPLDAAAHGQFFDLVVDLEAGTVDSALTGHDHIVNVENVKTGAGCDAILGNAQDNKLSAGAGHDYIDGNGGNDTLDGGAGSDVVLGGDGDDVIVATADAVSDFYSGGDGIDTFDASLVQTNIFIDLSEGAVTSLLLGNDTISGIENVKCGSGNDTITASDDVNVLFGGLGDDIFVFQSTASIGNSSSGQGGGHDKIMDFAVGDKIDISNISKEFANQLNDLYQDQFMKDFVLISNLDAFSKPGELQVSYDANKGATYISGNIDFDADAEFMLELQGQHSISISDFNHH